MNVRVRHETGASGDPSVVRAAAARLRVPPRELADLVRSAQHDWIVVSGKMASGKDTVAAELNTELYADQAVLLRYGDLMRQELDEALAAWSRDPDMPTLQAVALVRSILGLTPEQATLIVDALESDMRSSRGTLTAHDRTNGIRFALQSLGGSWRTGPDQDYWARSACLAALRAAQTSPVILTGGRFTPDVEIPRMLGATVIRLDVSVEVQRTRLAERDGLSPDEETLRHPGEVLLDDWEGFTARLDADRPLSDVVADAGAVVRATRRAASRRVNPPSVAR